MYLSGSSVASTTQTTYVVLDFAFRRKGIGLAMLVRLMMSFAFVTSFPTYECPSRVISLMRPSPNHRWRSECASPYVANAIESGVTRSRNGALVVPLTISALPSGRHCRLLH